MTKKMKEKLTPRTQFIMDVQERVQVHINPLLRMEMEEYAERFGFTDEDRFMWLACDIKMSIVKQGSTLKESTPPEKEE